ncbi:MAG: carboxylesterase [Gammaproteobacteria bacterium]|nr:carboxylesterase [Gammaproteobacteria bacterium]HBW84323.1 carboxylesterase [Gammaproteobacteria bacterium]|tara:strand:+ start:5439 stop:6194 length:756 start_codon:yes stop_codon:yes gene_type:complete
MLDHQGQIRDPRGQLARERRAGNVAYLPAVEIEYRRGGAIDASVIWLHGLGADGNDFAPIVQQLPLSDKLRVRFVFPHAPSIPVTINNGLVMPAWYDIKQLDVDRHVDTEQLRESARWVHDLVQREIERGVPSERIVIAGFSQGGAVSLEAALTYPHRLAGIMALSTYFATASTVAINPVQQALPILVCHGSGDPVVAESLGRKSVENLQKFGFNPEYVVYPMEHAVCPQQIVDLGGWIERTLIGQQDPRI